MKKIETIILNMFFISGMAFGSFAMAVEGSKDSVTVQKISFLSSNYKEAAIQGEVWVKIDSKIYDINTGCPKDWYGENGYVVAAFKDDAHGKEFISGLLTAKATSKTVYIYIDNTRLNARGMCFISYYEVNP